ncbi:MAG: VOC family protein [Flavobacteriaceae bacterium]
MRLFVFIFICLFMPVSMYSQSAEMGVGAIGLVVSDIAASEHFYTDILGMQHIGGFELSEEWSKEAGMSNNRPFAVKSYKMVNSESATVLKLAYFDQLELSNDLQGIEQRPGVNYLTFYYQDLMNVRKRITNAKIPIVGEVERESYALLIIRDPDGVYVELIERR